LTPSFFLSTCNLDVDQPARVHSTTRTTVRLYSLMTVRSEVPLPATWSLALAAAARSERAYPTQRLALASRRPCCSYDIRTSLLSPHSLPQLLHPTRRIPTDAPGDSLQRGLGTDLAFDVTHVLRHNACGDETVLLTLREERLRARNREARSIHREECDEPQLAANATPVARQGRGAQLLDSGL